MKIKHCLLLVSICVSTIFSSCGDDEKTSSPTPIVIDTKVYFTCRISNVNFVDETRFSDYSFGTARIVSHNETQLIRIDFDNDTTGTYYFTPGDERNMLIYLDENEKEYNSISGSITVTEFSKVNKIISGTFSGILKSITDNSLITISEGKFNYVVLNPF